MESIDMTEEENTVIANLDLLLRRSLRSKKRTGTRLFILKALADLGSGWHTTTDVLEKLKSYGKGLPRKMDHIFELASHYRDLVETDISAGLPLKDTHVKIKDEIYPIVARHIDDYISKLSR